MQCRGAARDRTDHVEGRIAFLELKITDDQVPLWEAVATAMRDRSATMNTLRDDLRPERATGEGERDRAERRQSLTAPESLALREKATSARAKAPAVDAKGQRRFTAALGALYNQLNDEQKKTADQLLAGPRHRS